MPIMNGLTATSRIRDFERNGTKPFRITELLEKIKDNIEKLAGARNTIWGMGPL
jgi:CheY-like chemotaxis protein